MTEFRTKWEIPTECRWLVEAWMQDLTTVDGLGMIVPISRKDRYVVQFRDNGIVDEIHIKDLVSGKTFDWAPPLDQW